MSEQVDVRDNPDEQRYEITVDGTLAGFAVYRLDGPDNGRTVFVHTEISPDFGGRGLGNTLAAAALDDVRARGRLAVPICPFIAAFVRRHPEYQDLVAREGEQR
ncbi:GNAT family N-acetyltransferase [Jatrophihabitans fulvus]